MKHLLHVRALLFVIAVAVPGLGLITLSSSASGAQCEIVASDNDVEYAGDRDVFCSLRVLPTAMPTLIPSPSVTPTAIPAATATPSPLPTSISTPTPTPGAVTPPTSTPAPIVAPPPSAGCHGPGSFPASYFAPNFGGAITRVFSQQFIAQQGDHLTVCYPAGSTAPSSGQAGGAQAELPLIGGPADDATLTYRIRFPVGFQFVKGGKLPGLCGAACWTGSNNGPGGFAARFMWRAGGVGEVLLSDATTTGYGTDLGRGTSFDWRADGSWHLIGQHLHLNTPGQADGWIDLTYDGRAVAHFSGLTFRTDAATRIDGLMFSTFFGGHDSTWAPTADQTIDFANFSLTR